MSTRQIVLLTIVALAIGAFFLLDLQAYLSFEYFQSQRERIVGAYEADPFEVAAIFLAAYVMITGLSLPFAAVMTIAAGAIFGLWVAVLIVSFASTIGATIAFLISRTLLRDWVQRRFGAQLKLINAGIERDGSFYLFSIRMVPLFPFIIVNLVMALTPMRTGSFYVSSQLGMLAGTVVYVFAGTQVAQLQSAGDLVSPGLQQPHPRGVGPQQSPLCIILIHLVSTYPRLHVYMQGHWKKRYLREMVLMIPLCQILNRLF